MGNLKRFTPNQLELLGKEMSLIKNQELLRKVIVLRQYENYGYQIAYYLLENEALAIKAATQALLELFKADKFFHQPLSFQKQLMKKVFIKHSLLTKASMATGS
ncbi:hypothetical protein [Cohnella boryungensis]|uniref:hypothetical protein n=1 Tax=Cohnella boryungensis TaxID=768479 RepID=UPI00195EC7F0